MRRGFFIIHELHELSRITKTE